MNNFLEIKSLRAWYGASQALFDVNLKIKEGEIVALLGRNGMVNQLQLNQYAV